MEKIRLGIIGIGNMGSEHCRLILSGQTPEIALTCVADPRQDRRDWAQQTLPAGTGIYADGMSLIRAHACDAVLIATPHELHPPLAEAALRAGLHVLSEKPAGVYTAQLHPVIAAAQETGRTYALMFNQRTNCVYRRLKALLDSGELGALKRVTWVVTDWYRSQAYYDSGAWRATWTGEGGGVLLNQCPHQLDLLQWLCGLPTTVRAFCHEGKWHDIEVEDDVTAYLEFPGGATGVFIASTGELPGTNRLEIACDRGKVVCENGQLTLWRLPQSLLPPQRIRIPPRGGAGGDSAAGRGESAARRCAERFCGAYPARRAAGGGRGGGHPRADAVQRHAPFLVDRQARVPAD